MANYRIVQDDARCLQTQINGFDGVTVRKVRTDTSGILITAPTKTFTEYSQPYSTPGTGTNIYSNTIDISTFSVYTYFVTSSGGATQFVIQISPDGVIFIDDGILTPIPDGAASVFVANNFLKYIRLRIVDSGTATTGTVFFQAQS